MIVIDASKFTLGVSVSVFDDGRVHKISLTNQGASDNLQLYINLINEYGPATVAVIGHKSLAELNGLIEFLSENEEILLELN